MRIELPFFPEFEAGFTPIGWIHNDSMYVRFGGIRNTKTWSKSTNCLSVFTVINKPFKLKYVVSFGVLQFCKKMFVIISVMRF